MCPIHPSYTVTPDVAETSMIKVLVDDTILEALVQGTSSCQFHEIKIQATRRLHTVVLRVTRRGETMETEEFHIA